ncbi:MAG: alpha/beta hydrolase [Treponema sp.]|nr:alpha/beta hydrolase [Treponema sp.]
MPSKEMQGLIGQMKMMMEKGFVPKFDGGMDVPRLRAVMESAQKAMPTESGVTFIPETLAGIEAEICTPQNARADAVIFYIHGGGFVCGNAFTSRGYGSLLAGETKIPVHTLSYRLAPEHPYPAAVDDCFNAYKDLAQRHTGKPVFLIGESGGGLLCLTTALKAKDAGLPLPAGVIAYSPIVDFSGILDRSANEGKDFTVNASWLGAINTMYCPDEGTRKDPYVSPVYGNYVGFPPLFLAWDSTETLAADSEQIAQMAKEAGVEVQSKSYPDCFHAFATAGRGTPESAEVLAATVTFIKGAIQ